MEERKTEKSHLLNSRVIRRMVIWQEGSPGAGEVKGRWQVRRARKILQTSNCVIGTYDTEGSPEASIHFNILVGTTDNHFSLLSFGIGGNEVSFGPHGFFMGFKYTFYAYIPLAPSPLFLSSHPQYFPLFFFYLNPTVPIFVIFSIPPRFSQALYGIRVESVVIHLD